MFKKAALSLCLFVFGVAGAHAVPVTVSTYTPFSFGAVGSVSGPFTFTAAAASTLLVLDEFASGDRFNVFDFGSLLGQTSAPTLGAPNCGGNPATCLADLRFSRGLFNLASGAHVITIIPTASPFGGGGATLRYDPAMSPVPEPSTLLLLGTGMVGLIGVAKSRFVS